ncbi:hypothetical protein [Bhargavaea massiliensis]|uniref:hypothetical protein n=1 Tax=Bhargavaea massiliensis TaxID=2697500 RepID=UPI001BCBF60E|nr:hypothetical protein [Bhargavaea massiliensis]
MRTVGTVLFYGMMAIFLAGKVSFNLTLSKNPVFIGFLSGLMGILYETGGDVVENFENHR